MIRCSACTKGKMVRARVENHDVGALVGLDQVVVVKADALRCKSCGAVMLEGPVVEAIHDVLARMIVRQDELKPKEVRFLRELLGMTQAQLAERLGLTRVTVARWETAEGDIGTVPSLALRTLAAWHLDDPMLAREIGAPRRTPGLTRTAPPYMLDVA
jgi:putative zinc finger/helix-turn-helix YgiT family protein